MSVIDTDPLLQAVSDEAPSGEDLEYDPAFAAMERAAEGRPEQVSGDSTIEAEPPDWREVKSQALDVLGRSHDLRAAVYLARATLHSDGFVGFSEALGLVKGLVETYWDTVHPELDPDDDNDPTMRVNAIEALANMEATLRGVREAPLVASRMLGRYGIREIEYADGTLALPEDHEGDAPNTAAIEAAFMDADLDEIIATSDAITQSIEHVEAIDELLRGYIDVASTPDLAPLVDLLKHAHQAMVGPMERRGIGVEAIEGDEAAAEGGGAPQQRISGDITSREDVVRTLEKICEYYGRSEPASPVPLLLKRAQRLATMDFMEIVKDMTPSGVSEAQIIAGLTDEGGDEY